MTDSMRALVSAQRRIRLEQRPIPQPGPGQVRVRLKTAALNHRDLRLARTREAAEPVVLGSDGAGILDAVGPGVDLAGTGLELGAEVVVNPSLGWLDEVDAPPPGFQILGDPSDGTLAEYVVVPLANVEPKPANLSWVEAAAFPLAGLTAYRAVITRGQVDAGKTVLIPGIGGGVATFALQIAKARGARVFVTSRSPDKLARAQQLGADAGLSSDGDWQEEVRRLTGGRGVDVVIETVGVPTWPKSLASLAPGGRLVFFAAGPGPSGRESTVELPLRRAFFQQWNILGTAMGNRREFRALLDLLAGGALRPIVDSVFPFDRVEAAFQRLEEAAQFGKIVIEIG